MKVKYIAAILLSTQLVYTACDDMGFLQIKPDSLELTDDRIKTVDDLENYCWVLIEYVLGLLGRPDVAWF